MSKEPTVAVCTEPGWTLLSFTTSCQIFDGYRRDHRTLAILGTLLHFRKSSLVTPLEDHLALDMGALQKSAHPTILVSGAHLREGAGMS
eukprot:2823629-Amphidinium_carterae.1